MTLKIIYYIKIPNKEVFEKSIDLKKDIVYITNITIWKKKYWKIMHLKKYINNVADDIFEKNIEKTNKNLFYYLKLFNLFHLFFKYFKVSKNSFQVLMMQMFLF